MSIIGGFDKEDTIEGFLLPEFYKELFIVFFFSD